MLLDAVLATKNVSWLATEREKVTHFTVLLQSRLNPEELPHLVFGNGASTTTRYFPDKLPVGVQKDGRHVFTYLVNRPTPVDFRPFLHRHAELLKALPRWTVRLLVPSHLAEAASTYEAAWRDEFARPLRLSTADELRWYFQQRSRLEQGEAHSDETRYNRARRAFGAPRYRVLYRSWRQQGPGVLTNVVSPVLADAVTRRTGELETQVLPHPYLHLAPLVATA
jgi:hypothetical protein